MVLCLKEMAFEVAGVTSPYLAEVGVKALMVPCLVEVVEELLGKGPFQEAEEASPFLGEVEADPYQEVEEVKLREEEVDPFQEEVGGERMEGEEVLLDLEVKQ